jgi:GNAT superfamily N-acetyltransferase
MNIQSQKETIVELPEGFTARGATMDDLEPAIALFNRWSRSVIGRDEFTDLEILRNDLQLPGFDLTEDMRLVFAPNGELAGYIEAWTVIKPPVHPWIWGRVDPQYEGKGIGTWMMHWAEEHVLRVLPEVPEEFRFAPQVSTYREAEKAKRLFEKFGYRYFRSSYHM